MRKEVLGYIGLGIAAFELSKTAFTISARKEIGRRDRWECQGREERECCMVESTGKAARFQDGYYVTAAHYPEDHHHSGKGYHDTETAHGRILCTIDHALEEIGRDNEWGAKKLLEDGVYTRNHVKETGEQWIPTLEEIQEFDSPVVSL